MLKFKFNNYKNKIKLDAMESKINISRESKVAIVQSTSNYVSNETEIELGGKFEQLHLKNNSSEAIERIIKYADPPKSYLYRNKTKENRKHNYAHRIKDKVNSSYVPMDIGGPKIKKERKRSRINDYIHFDLTKLSLFPSGHKNENKFDDRGYYALKNAATAAEKSVSYEICENVNFGRRSMEEKSSKLGIEVDEHFYEDLNIFPETSQSINKKEILNTTKKEYPLSKSPCLLKINEIFSTIRFPIHSKLGKSSKTYKKHELNTTEEQISGSTTSEADNEIITNSKLNQMKIRKILSKEKEEAHHVYENNESNSALYASIEGNLNKKQVENTGRFMITKVPIEEYLEPIHKDIDYTDVMFKDNDKSLVNMIRRIMESGCRFRRECEKAQETVAEKENTKPTISNPIPLDPPERPLETLQIWSENLKANHKAQTKTNMADRPLPVPVESEFYFMEVDRLEASKLLEGHPDGTFILRPSSQPFHAYTISLVYHGEVHNVGVRRRSDGQLALGFSKRAELSFGSVAQLVRHHYRERLVLIVDGRTIGSTRLRPPHN